MVKGRGKKLGAKRPEHVIPLSPSGCLAATGSLLARLKRANEPGGDEDDPDFVGDEAISAAAIKQAFAGLGGHSGYVWSSRDIDDFMTAFCPTTDGALAWEARAMVSVKRSRDGVKKRRRLVVDKELLLRFFPHFEMPSAFKERCSRAQKTWKETYGDAWESALRQSADSGSGTHAKVTRDAGGSLPGTLAELQTDASKVRS